MARPVLLAAMWMLVVPLVAGDVATLRSVFDVQQQANSVLMGAAVSVFDTTGYRPEFSGSFGTTDSVSDPMLLDTLVHTNEASELIVATAVLQLVAASVLPTLDATISVTLLPGQVSLVNPTFASTPITLRMLLTHTSTLMDTDFESARGTSPTAVPSLTAFVEGYFVTTTGGVNTLNSAIFSTALAPGSAGAYSEAKINTALLTYIVERAVNANPALVTTGVFTALSYVREKILNPLGMVDTPTLTTTGTFPTLSYPALGELYTGAEIEARQGGTVITTRTLHPAYFSDYMTFSSAADLGTLAHRLFLFSSTTAESSLTSIGSVMKQLTAVTSAVEGVTGTGLGIRYFNGAALCAAAIATGAVSRCPLDDTTSVYGYVASGEFSVVGIFCIDALSASTSATCVATVHAHEESTTPLSESIAYALAASAFQVAVGDTTIVLQETYSSSATDGLLVLKVLGALVGIVLFVLIAAKVTEGVIPPVPLHPGMPVPGANGASMMTPARVPTDTQFNSR